MSWWPFGRENKSASIQEPEIFSDPITDVELGQLASSEETVAFANVEPLIAEDPRKSEIDALVNGIDASGVDDRLEYLKSEEPLREMAERSAYADSQMKALRKRFFERIQAKAEAKNLEEANGEAFARLVIELTDHGLIEDWFKKTCVEYYEEQTIPFVLDLTEGHTLGVTLSDAVEQRGNAKTDLNQRYGSKTIRAAAEAVECKFFEDLNRLINFFDDREVSILPNFRRVLATATNKYGDPDYSTFYDEVSEFCEYASKDTDLSALSYYVQLTIIGDYIIHRIEGLKEVEVTEDQIPVDGFEFEVWCAEQIQRQGWQIEATPKSGDQGVDIVVRRDGFTVAVQCKRYSSPIGNAAVQEVHSGRTFVSAKGAIVVGTGGFTKAARSIAAISKVELLDALDIANFSEIFGFKSQAAKLGDQQLFSAESYGQCEIIKSVFFGMKLTRDEATTGPLSDVLEVLKTSFDPVTGRGSTRLTGVQVAGILLYSSAVYVSAGIRLNQETRDHFANQDDMNKLLLTDPEVIELMWYQFYDAAHMEQILEAFKGYVSQFGVHQTPFAFLSEFE